MITTKDTPTQILVYDDVLGETLIVQKPWADKGLHRAAYVQIHGRTVSPDKAARYCTLIVRAAEIAQELNTAAGYK